MGRKHVREEWPRRGKPDLAVIASLAQLGHISKLVAGSIQRCLCKLPPHQLHATQQSPLRNPLFSTHPPARQAQLLVALTGGYESTELMKLRPCKCPTYWRGSKFVRQQTARCWKASSPCCLHVGWTCPVHSHLPSTPGVTHHPVKMCKESNRRPLRRRRKTRSGVLIFRTPLSTVAAFS